MNILRGVRAMKINYEKYVEAYKAEAAKHPMYAPMFDEVTYIAVYTGMRNEYKAAGKKPANICRTIVQKQAYEITYKQARAFKRARKTLRLPELSIQEIRLLGKAKALDWDRVKAYKKAQDGAKEIVKKIKLFIKEAKENGNK